MPKTRERRSSHPILITGRHRYHPIMAVALLLRGRASAYLGRYDSSPHPFEPEKKLLAL